MNQQISQVIQEKLHQYVNKERCTDNDVRRKLMLCEKRNATIIKVTADGRLCSSQLKDDYEIIKYDLHLKYDLKHKDGRYVEEEIERREAVFHQHILIDDYLDNGPRLDRIKPLEFNEAIRNQKYYDRDAAVAYANKWWDNYNPEFRHFEVDCTNYVSQCLFAGGAPMRGAPNRTNGWWTKRDTWSFSWTVANALTVYLSHSTSGLRAKEVSSPKELHLGDVICYDFQGDGKYDHTTIVTNFDADGMPLVNAHTANSRNRYWSYEDSTAYTSNIQYKFFTIIDD